MYYCFFSNPIIHPKQIQLLVIQVVVFLVVAVDTAFDTNYTIACAAIPLFVKLGLMQIDDTQNIFPFRTARLADRDGDLSKRWYINYYVWDVQKNALTRRQDYTINNYKTKNERYAVAKLMIKQINDLLAKGFHIDRTKSKQNPENLTQLSLGKAVELALDIKKTKIAHSSYLSYSSQLTTFINYIEETGQDILPVTQFKKVNAIRYLDYLLTSTNLAPVTVNKARDFLKAIFTMLTEREIIPVNPWFGIKKEKEIQSKQNIAFSETDIKRVLTKLKNTDTELLAFVKIIFYTFMRPNEIRQLKVKHIFLNENKINLPAEISKNRTRGFVDIPKQLISTIKIVIRNKENNEFLFQSVNGKPYGKNAMTSRHREILVNLNLNEHTLYSWKHTGVVQAYNNGVSMKSIQLQCRHHSIAQTDEYLKSLGFIPNTQVLHGMPNLPI